MKATKKQTNGIDWEQRRYEIAKDVIQADISRWQGHYAPYCEEIVLNALRIADEMIKQLNGK